MSFSLSFSEVGKSGISSFSFSEVGDQKRNVDDHEYLFYFEKNAFRMKNKKDSKIHLKPLRKDNLDSWQNYMDICKGQRIASIKKVGKDILLAIHEKHFKLAPQRNVCLVIEFNGKKAKLNFGGYDSCNEDRYNSYLNTMYGCFLNYCVTGKPN